MNTAVNPQGAKSENPAGWRVGTSQFDITPSKPGFLYGYPHVPRQSTGVHDPLLVTAFWLDQGQTPCLWLGFDLIWMPRQTADQVRQKVGSALGLSASSIMISATHTHSGPVTMKMLSNHLDPVVPDPDPGYMDQVVDAAVDAACAARDSARPAELRLGQVSSKGLGGNRRDPNGPSYATWPVLFAVQPGGAEPFAIMSVCAMHPTVLHEDSTVISGDFPGLARRSLQESYGPDTIYLHHMGASGNLSPRRAVTANTLQEAQRLGDMLAQRVRAALAESHRIPAAPVRCLQAMCDLPPRQLPDETLARRACQATRSRFDYLRKQGAEAAIVRTAEVDWFGAEETLALVQARDAGRFVVAAASCLPAEVQVIDLGELTLIGWPGEVFVQFAQAVTDRYPNAHIITLANGDLQGYLVTTEAVQEGAYEAGNALFASPQSAEKLVDTTLDLLSQLGSRVDRTVQHASPDNA